MFVERLELVDFRSYVRADVPMTAGATTFIGSNGQGKTNLVEAVEYLSTLSSHRVSNDTPLVRLGADQAVVRGRVRAGTDDARSLLLEVEINARRANRARINRAPLTRPRDILGVLRTVVFSPNDLAVVRGDPSDRRAFLDGLVVTRWPRMAAVKSDYERVLKQRNALLKSLSGKGRSAGAEIGATMDIWDNELATIGAELLSARLDTLSAIMPLISTAYREIAPANDLTTASYKSTIDLEGLWSPQQERESSTPIDRKELIRGVTLVGPQRDDIILHIGEMPAKGYASHGESWSLALALRLGSFQLLRDDGIEPVLVLDDVFAELDATRRDRLASSVVQADQVLVTAAVASDVPEILRGERFDVGGGQVLAYEGNNDD